MDEARHVVPASEIQADEILAQIEQKLFHLIRQRVRFDQRHRPDRARLPAFSLDNRVEERFPPERLFRRLGLWNVDAQRMPQPVVVQPKRQEGDVEQRCAGQRSVGKDARLAQVQAAHAIPNDRLARHDADGAAAFRVVVGQLSVKRGDQVVVPGHEVVPAIEHRVFEIEHHAGRPGVEHLDDELGVVGRPRHLVALIGAPRRQLDTPIGGRRFRRGQVGRKVAGVRARERRRPRGG